MSLDEGDERLERLFTDHRDIVRRYARRGASDAEAPDIVSEVFSIAWRKLGQVPDEPVGWLLAVARRVRANQIRAGRRRTALTARC